MSTAASRVYLSVSNPDDVESSLRNYGFAENEVDLLVATDSEGILGMGDQGVGGIDIAIGKPPDSQLGALVHQSPEIGHVQRQLQEVVLVLTGLMAT
jgi:hypothetical protein